MRKIGFVMLLLAAVLTGTLLYMLWPKLMDYKKSRDLYDRLRNEAVVSEEPAAGETEAESDIEYLEEIESEIEADSVKGKTMEDLLIEAGVPEDQVEKYMPPKIDGSAMKKLNEDYLGWIYVPETDISYPVVKSEDNADYLHKNFEGDYNYPGTIFMDCRCKNGIYTHHSILYGHNMRDGSMFAGLKSNYKNEESALEHPVFWFITEDYALLYKVFSSYIIGPKDEVAFGVDGLQLKDNSEWDETVNAIKEASEFDFGGEVNGRSYVVSLSTCTTERTTRKTVHGYLIGSQKNSEISLG